MEGKADGRRTRPTLPHLTRYVERKIIDCICCPTWASNGKKGDSAGEFLPDIFSVSLNP
jgi:hypothetical protein